MSQIRTVMAQNPFPTSSRLIEYDNVAQNISNHLNTIWDPAWNVMIFNLHYNVDAVVYGYAFRNHWLWFNGVPHPENSSLFMSYIIWKDYNCFNWIKVGTTGGSFSTNQFNVILALKNAISANQIINDLWNTAYNYVVAIESNSNFANTAFSAIITQDPTPSYGGYCCTRNQISFTNVGTFGSLHLLQMRWKTQWSLSIKFNTPSHKYFQ